MERTGWSRTTKHFGLIRARGNSATRDAQPLDQLVQTGAADFEFDSSAAQVTFVARQSGFNHLPFDGLTSLAQALAFVSPILRKTEIFRGNPSVFRHDRSTLDTVLELTNIARPAVCIQGFDRLW